MSKQHPIQAYLRSVGDVLGDPVPVLDLPDERTDHLVPLAKFLPDADGATLDLAPLEALVRATLDHEVHGRASTDEERNALDGWLAPRVHAAIRVSRRVASSDAFWRWLALEHAAPLIDLRFGGPKGVPRWRLTGAALRNGLSRLWWGAELTRDGPDYGLLPHVFARTRTAQFALELSYSQYRTAAIAFTRVAEGLDGGPRLSDPAMTALSRSANARLSLRVLEAATSPALDGPRDVRWWHADPDVDGLVSEDGPTGPDDGHADPDEVAALCRWFRDVASNDGGTTPPATPDVKASSDDAATDPSADAATTLRTQDDAHEGSDGSDGGYEWTAYGTRYLDHGLPDPWIPILDPLVEDSAWEPTPERWNPEGIDRTIREAFERDARSVELLTDRFARGATLREIARDRDVTRQRIEQLEKKALTKVAAYEEAHPVEVDDDLRPRLRDVDERPLVLETDDPATSAARLYVAWALRERVKIVEVGACLVFVGDPVLETLERLEVRVASDAWFRTLEGLATDASTSPETVRTLVAIGETLYTTRDGHVGSKRWTNVAKMAAIAHALAASELGVTQWHGSEIGAAAKRVFPETFEGWSVRDAFGTLARPNQDVFERVGERGYWGLVDAPRG